MLSSSLLAALVVALNAREALGVAVWGQCGGMGYTGTEFTTF